MRTPRERAAVRLGSEALVGVVLVLVLGSVRWVDRAGCSGLSRRVRTSTNSTNSTNSTSTSTYSTRTRTSTGTLRTRQRWRTPKRARR
jgi:hypothetical protein